MMHMLVPQISLRTLSPSYMELIRSVVVEIPHANDLQNIMITQICRALAKLPALETLNVALSASARSSLRFLFFARTRHRPGVWETGRVLKDALRRGGLVLGDLKVKLTRLEDGAEDFEKYVAIKDEVLRTVKNMRKATLCRQYVED